MNCVETTWKDGRVTVEKFENEEKALDFLRSAVVNDIARWGEWTDDYPIVFTLPCSKRVSAKLV